MADVPISVVIPHYNRSHLIGDAIESVRRQTLRPLEIIVVDDGSDPCHREALQRFSSMARILQVERNQGPPSARNLGLEAACGEYLAFLDDDDEWFPDKLELQWNLLRSDATLDAVAAPMMIRGESRSQTILRSHSPEIVTLPAALEGTPALFQTLLVRTSVMRQLRGCDPLNKVIDDQEFWIRFTHAGFKARYMSQPVAYLDRRNIRRVTSDREQYLACQLAIVEKHQALYEQTFGKGAARRERAKTLRRHGSHQGGVAGRLTYLQGCLMATEWRPLLHLLTTGQMLEVPYVRISDLREG